MFNNLAVLMGRLTADPELKTTQSGISVCSFDIAVDRPYKKDEEKTADFIKIVAWRNHAEFVSHYFTKGSRIGIEGSIQTRRYQDSNGNNRTAFEVVANNVQFIDKKMESLAVQGDTPSFNNGNDFEDMGEVTDDDLPF